MPTTTLEIAKKETGSPIDLRANLEDIAEEGS